MELLPEAFVEHTRSLLGEDEYKEFESSLLEESPVSIRINKAKPVGTEFNSHDRVFWCETGYYLPERLTFTFDPLFHAGCYYVQEASSMFPEQVIKEYINTPVTALDLCAAPGGKSTHIRSLLPEGSLLVANEVIRNRSQILAENIIKWGHPDVIVTNNDPSDFSGLKEIFDLIFIDAPCSGEGMFRKDEGAVKEWSNDAVNICWQRQRRIVADVWESLKPGGILVYSTCTYNTKENEENIAWIMQEYAAQPLPIDAPAEKWGITNNLLHQSVPVYRFLPHKTKGEGFFFAILRKQEDTTQINYGNSRVKAEKKQGKTPTVPSDCKSWLCNPKNFIFEMKGSVVTAFHQSHIELLQIISRHLQIVHAGITVGELKGKDILPHHSLAMSQSLNKAAFATAELTHRQAVSYLRKEAIVLDDDIPRGYVLLTYKENILGFVKNIGNRANNLYPLEWRIRSGYLPEELRIL